MPKRSFLIISFLGVIVLAVLLLVLQLRREINGADVLRSLATVSRRETILHARSIPVTLLEPRLLADRRKDIEVDFDGLVVAISTPVSEIRFWHTSNSNTDARARIRVTSAAGEQFIDVVDQAPFRKVTETPTTSSDATRLKVFSQVLPIGIELTQVTFSWTANTPYDALTLGITKPDARLSVRLMSDPSSHDLTITPREDTITAIENVLRLNRVDAGRASAVTKVQLEKLSKLSMRDRWERILAFDAKTYESTQGLDSIAEGALIALFRTFSPDFTGEPAIQFKVGRDTVYLTPVRRDSDGARFGVMSFDELGVVHWEGSITLKVPDATAEAAAEMISQSLMPTNPRPAK